MASLNASNGHLHGGQTTVENFVGLKTPKASSQLRDLEPSSVNSPVTELARNLGGLSTSG